MLNDCIYIPNFIINNDFLFSYLKKNIDWCEDIKSRKTASFGLPYNYSNTFYLESNIPDIFVDFFSDLKCEIGFTPNNVLLNFYSNGASKMGYHSDNIDILENKTGVAIISLGSERIIRFKNKLTNEIIDFILEPGSLFYMNQNTQKKYVHSILKSNNDVSERISITLRKIKIINK
jgi:alkylated DNA repair dioxygenase AlkB